MNRNEISTTQNNFIPIRDCSWVGLNLKHSCKSLENSMRNQETFTLIHTSLFISIKNKNENPSKKKSQSPSDTHKHVSENIQFDTTIFNLKIISVERNQ